MDDNLTIGILILIIIVVAVVAAWYVLIMPAKYIRATPLEIPSISDKAEVLLLTCIDYRFFDRINAFMVEQGYRNRYDHFVLAGSALAVTSVIPTSPGVPNVKQWQLTWQDHLGLAVDLHNIKKVIIFQHEDCAAMATYAGFNDTRADIADINVITPAEIAFQTPYTQAAHISIKKAYPHIEVESYIIGLQENIIRLAPPLIIV